MVTIAVIPARGGSKRIPRKNIKLFHGKPIIAYSIEVALESGLFDHVIVSTDDKEIAEVAQKYGAEVPFIRPKELSDDVTGTNLVVDHALSWFEDRGIDVQYACCIYATAPLLQKKHLKAGYDKLYQMNKSFVFSATKYPFPIQRAIFLETEETPYPADEEAYNRRSQDLQEAYHDAGQFYWGDAASFKKEAVCFSKKTGLVILPTHQVCDIDTEEDFFRAEKMYLLINEVNE